MIIRISDTSLTTTLGIGTTIADNHDFLDEYSTIVSCLTSSLSSSPINDTYIYLNSSNNYINSLSNEQIVMLEEKIAAKQEEVLKVGNQFFTMTQVEELTTPSIKDQTVGKQSGTNSKTYKKI